MSNYKRHRRRAPLFEGEEMLSHAKAENERRIAVLKSVKSSRAKRLARKLRRCRSGDRCGSPACSVCNWFNRRKHIHRFWKLTKSHGLKYMVTIFTPVHALKANGLRQFSVHKFRDRLRSQFKRTGSNQAIVFGGFELVYKPDLRKFVPHWHLVVGGATKEELDALRRNYLPKSRAIKIERIEPGDELKVLSYTHKNTTSYKKKGSRQPHKLSARVEARVLCFMDQHSFHDLLYLKGVRFNGDTINFVSPRRSSKSED